MKKILLSLLLLAGTGYAVKTFGQITSVVPVGGCAGGAANCGLGITNSVVTIESSKDSSGFCVVVFTVEFDLTYNSGNKDIFIHSWLGTDYPAYFPCSSGTIAAPTHTILGTAISDPGKSFLDIGLDNSVNRGAVGVPVNIPIYTVYQPDPTVILTSPLNSPGMVATKTYIAGTTDHVKIQHVRILINGGCSGLVVYTDVWSRNGTGSPAQCWVAGIRQGFNDPLIAGFKVCSEPRTYRLGITTGDATPSTLTYRVYIDVNSNGSIENVGLPGGDIDITSSAGSGTYANFSSSNGFSTGVNPIAYPPYSSDPAYASKPLIITATTNLIGNTVAAIFADPQGCIPLPVNFKSFTATRNHSNVLLKWETSFEQNSNGFAIERNIRGTWEQIAFVPSQASGGNSNSALAYQLNDLNDVRGMSQYRIKQVDFDARAKYSEIRAVRGEGQAGNTIVYPNPSFDGRVSVVFEDATVARDVSLSDMAGRTLKQWKGVTNNNIQIDNLTPGMYTLRIVVPETGEQSVQKIIVSKH